MTTIKPNRLVDVLSIGDAKQRKYTLKDITTIRADNFNLLFAAFIQEVLRQFPDEPEKGMLRRFAYRAGLTDRYASHLKCRHKGMGHSTARKMEEKLGLPDGWMDQDHEDMQPGSTMAIVKPAPIGLGPADAAHPVSAPVSAPAVAPAVIPAGNPGLAEFLQAAEAVYLDAPELAQSAIMKLLVERMRRPS